MSYKKPEQKLQTISFRLPKNMIEFLDYLVDGVYIRDRTHAIRLLLEESYRSWLKDKKYVDRYEYIKGLIKSLFETDEDIAIEEAMRIGVSSKKSLVRKENKGRKKKKPS
jgi:Arc/MetJ-type ribon-helix-helix transcriptional regulator